MTLLPKLGHPDPRSAVTVGSRTLGYEELAGACAAHAEGLERAGVRAGDHVAVWTQPELETLVALVGNALYGAVSVPLSPRLGARELEHITSDAAPVRAFAASPEQTRARTPEVPTDPIPLDPRAEGPCPVREVDDQPLLILYTSGTTGAPKGAVLTARNVATNLDALADAWAWSERDTVVHALPLFHVHGLVLGLFGSLRVGGAMQWMPPFEPHAIANALSSGGTMLFAVPTMYNRLADAGEQNGDVARGLSAARLLVSGSAALPEREHKRIRELAGQGVYERYGLTETVINCAVRADGPPRPRYVGPPLEGVELRLVDDKRRPLEAYDDATIGEVAVRGPNVFAGYLNRPDATAETKDEEGWFYTGDLATRASDGTIRIVGRRATDLIKTGGYKVGAGEVEGCLREHPLVGDAAVVGVPDDDLGERIVAFVVPREHGSAPEADALSQHVADALAPHKRPRQVHVIDELPRNPMGKVRKPALKARLAPGAEGG
jgi:malonyl-CoA/methylmalonyl-CoA synthetase